MVFQWSYTDYDYYSYQNMETYQYNFTTITKGVCSPDTVTKLATRECQKYLAAEPNKIYTTLNIIMNDMCAADEIPSALDGLRLNREDFKKAHPSMHMPIVQDGVQSVYGSTLI